MTGDIIVLEVKDFVSYLKVPLGDAVPQQHGATDGQPIAASALQPTATGEKSAPDSEGNAFANGVEGQIPTVDAPNAVEQKRRDLNAEAKSLKRQLTHTTQPILSELCAGQAHEATREEDQTRPQETTK